MIGEAAGRVVAPGNRGRKVRSPQGGVPANGRGSGDGYGKCHRKYTAAARKAAGKGEMVR